MSTVDPEKYLEQRNQSLWTELLSFFPIEIKTHAASTYGCFTNQSPIVIYVPEAGICTGAFTHELLHIYLKTKEIFIGGFLIGSIRESPVLSPLFSETLLEHLGNALEHVKMLPLFLHLGFAREKFIADYHADKCTDHELTLVEYFLQPGQILRNHAVDLYIGKFIAIKACPNNTIDYIPALGRLQKANPQLYLVLDTFWQDWDKYDINSTATSQNKYYDLCDNFLSGLTDWAKR